MRDLPREPGQARPARGEGAGSDGVKGCPPPGQGLASPPGPVVASLYTAQPPPTWGRREGSLQAGFRRGRVSGDPAPGRAGAGKPNGHPASLPQTPISCAP